MIYYDKNGECVEFRKKKNLGKKVYLELYVKVIPKWRDREKILNEIGYSDFTE